MTKSVDNAGPVGAIASMIRQALADRVQQRPGERTQQRSSNAAAGRLATPGGHGAPLQEVIARRVHALDPESPEFQSRVLRVVVEAALLQEFGDGLMHAPRFQAMVDEIWRELEAAPLLRADITSALSALRR